WALAGLHRLIVTNRKVFTRVSAADEAVAAMRDLASPVAAFVREHCDIGQAEYEIDVDQLYTDFKGWAENNGYPKTTKQLFGPDLHAASPAIRIKRPGASEGEKRRRVYSGIRLKEEC